MEETKTAIVPVTEIPAKKVRAMTAKGWLKKADAKVSAKAFLEATREFLSGEGLKEVTEPVFAQLDSGAIFPTPALEIMKAVVFGAHIAQETADALADVERKANEASMPKEHKESVPRVQKPWIATIFNGKGEVQMHTNKETGEKSHLVKGFDSSMDADRWTDRRLFDAASDCFGVVHSTIHVRKDGDPVSTTILRDDAMARLMKTAKGAVCKHKPKSADRLSFGVKVTNDRSIFSGG